MDGEETFGPFGGVFLELSVVEDRRLREDQIADEFGLGTDQAVSAVVAPRPHHEGRNAALEQLVGGFWVSAGACGEEREGLDQHNERVHEAYASSGTAGGMDRYAVSP